MKKLPAVSLLLIGLVLGAGACALAFANPLGWAWLDNLTASSGGGHMSQDTAVPERKVLYWRAPMDPNYTSDQPGKSPMGMDLVPVYEDEAPSDGGVRVSRAFLQNFAVRTVEVRRGTMPISIRTVGILAHNEEKVVSVQTKYEGWIERASVNNVGESVAEGDPLFEVYSPQLVTAQREFLGAMEYLGRLRESGAYPDAVDRAESLLEASRDRLRYWDMTEEQIDALAATKSVARTIQVFSPAAGFIVDKIGDSLEGMRLSPGMTILKIADHSTLWAETEFYEDDLRHVREGQAAVIESSAFPERRWRGRILFFRPAMTSETRTLTAFVEVANPDLRLRPKMYVDVSVQARGSAAAVMAPSEAILHSGRRAVVIIAKGDGAFEAREVELGMESDGMQEVTGGLAPGETLVVSSHFLIDSDSNLRAAIAHLLADDGEEGEEEAEPAETMRHMHNH